MKFCLQNSSGAMQLIIFCQCFLLWLPTTALSSSFEEQNNPTVSVTQGKVMGKIEVSRNHRKFVSFLGIPYAQPPKRFQVAEPPEVWNGTRDGKFSGDICLQSAGSGDGDGEVIGSEDCLYLNVFMPTFEASSRKLLPVLVFIAGENFVSSGPADMYGPQYMMDEDVILVTFNYRLGVLGFLSTGNGFIPGNLGLKDQVMLLKWVQGNIHVFGGDRMRVTLFGSGSGSIAVSLHLVSAMSSGLFANGISQSGTFSCPNALITEPEAVASQLLEKLNCSTNLASSKFRDCLEGKNSSEIILAQNQLMGWEKGKLVTPFGPTVEVPPKELFDGTETYSSAFRNNYNKFEESSFLTDFPENIIKGRHFKRARPWIVGVNSKAGYSAQIAVLKRNASFVEALNLNWTSVAPQIFQYSTTAKSPSYISLKVREFYFFNEQIDSSNLDQLYDAISDHNYFQCTKRSALLYGKTAPVYLYYFTYERVNHLRTPEVNGVGHGGEVQYFFKLNSTEFLEIGLRSRSFKFSKSIIQLWTSFAKLGEPKATWPTIGNWLPLPTTQVQGDSPLKWYRIDTEARSISVPFMARVNFWEKLNTTFKLEGIMDEFRKRRERRFFALSSSAQQRKLPSPETVSLHLYLIAILFYLLFYTYVIQQ